MSEIKHFQAQQNLLKNVYYKQMNSSKGSLPDKINFWKRARGEYEDSPEPFIYELDLRSPKPKPQAAKFIIIIKKFIDIFKNKMKKQFDHEDDEKNNYWNIIAERYQKSYEIRYVKDGFWEKPKSKLQKYFALLLHTKRIFPVLEELVKEIDFLYENKEEKVAQYEKQIKLVDFLKDGKYKIMGSLISEYEEQEDKMRTNDKLREKEEELEKQKQMELEKEKLKLRQIEQIKQLQRKRQEEKKKIQQQNRQQALKRFEQSKKTPHHQSRDLINSDYYPEQYIGSAQKALKLQTSKEIEIPMKNKKETKLKNSEKLYIERFKHELDAFTYLLKPEISEDKTHCHECKAELKAGFYLFGGNQNLCEYTGYWYCNDDISDERMPIPWKAIESFDLRGYSVSKVSSAELKVYYNKPLIQIQKDNPVIKKSQRLYDFLVLRRQIHLIYDSICNLDLIEPLLKNKLNYCLQMNLFSMKNLYDIYNGQQTPSLQKDYEILSRHFYRCEICQKKKGYICQKCQDPVKIFPFELRETHGCKKCRKLYHRKCLFNGECQCTQE